MTGEVAARELANQPVDYVAAAARAVVGTAPIVGPLLVELVGVVVPAQRIDRIARFAQQLEERVGSLEDELRSEMSDERFQDLLEAALRQSATAVGDERLAQIAAVVANGLTSEDVSYVDSKHILRVLGELNDFEVIRLGWLQFEVTGEGTDYWERHADVLERVQVYSGSPPSDEDRAALQESYDLHLMQLGLVDDDLDLTGFGRLLGRQIGVVEPRPS